MGGVLIIISIVIPTLLWADLRNPYVWIALFALLGLRLDRLPATTTPRSRKQRNLGLTGRRKMAYQILVALRLRGASSCSCAPTAATPPVMNVPVLQAVPAHAADRAAARQPLDLRARRRCRSSSSWRFVLVGSSNAVNLTDGLDGLAIGLMVIASGALTVLTYAGGHAQLAEYLQLARNPRTGELTIFCGAMTGATLGFLWYNAHPAEIFMGDVGSLGLGGGMAAVAVLIKQEILLRLHRRHLRAGGALGDPPGGQLQAAAASASSRWRRCTTISRRWAGRNRRSSRASGSRAWCWRCSR